MFENEESQRAIRYITSCLQKRWIQFILANVVLTLLFVPFLHSNTMENPFLRVAILGIPILCLFAFAVSILIQKGVNITKQIIMLGAILVLCVIAYGIYVIYSTSPRLATLLSYLILFFMIVALHGVLLQTMEEWLGSQTGWFGFFVELFYFIPCLLRDFIAYLWGEYQSTSRTIMTLFLLEIVLALLYFYLPAMVDWLTQPHGQVVLLPGTQWLNQKQTIGTAPQLQRASATSSVPQLNYAFSMWINLNIHPTSADSRTHCIFDYGGGKPRIEYIVPSREDTLANDERARYHGGKFLIQLSNAQHDGGPTSVWLDDKQFLLQKWNLVVLNYKEEVVDVFINGHLETSASLADHIPVYNTRTDVITIGDASGLDGAISGVTYYTHPLSTAEIQVIKKTYPSTSQFNIQI